MARLEVHHSLEQVASPEFFEVAGLITIKQHERHQRVVSKVQVVRDGLIMLRDVSIAKRLHGCADNNGQFGGTISRIALGTASYRTPENCTGSPSKLTGITSSV